MKAGKTEGVELVILWKRSIYFHLGSFGMSQGMNGRGHWVFGIYNGAYMQAQKNLKEG